MIMFLFLIFVFIFLIFVKAVWTKFFSREEENRGLSTSRNEEKRANAFNRSFSCTFCNVSAGYGDDFQDALNSQNQRELDKTLLSNDLDSSPFRTIESKAISSKEISSADLERCYINQLESNQKEDSKNIDTVPYSYILNRNLKGSSNEARLESIQPDKIMGNDSLINRQDGAIKSKGFTSKGIPDTISKSFHIHGQLVCNEAQLKSIQSDEIMESKFPISRQDEAIESKALMAEEILPTVPKTFDINSQLLSNETRLKSIQLDEIMRGKSPINRQDEAIKSKALTSEEIPPTVPKTFDINSQIVSNEARLESIQSEEIMEKKSPISRQDEAIESKAFTSKGIPPTIAKSFHNYSQLISNQNKEEEKIDSVLCSNMLNRYIKTCSEKKVYKKSMITPSEKNLEKYTEGQLNIFQTVCEPQDQGGTSLQLKDIQNKTVEESCPNFLFTQRNIRKEKKPLSSYKTKAVSNKKNGKMADKIYRYSYKKNVKRYFFSSQIVSKQQKAKVRRKAFASNVRDYPQNVGSFMCILFENQLYTDVTFISKGNKAILSAHRVVLAAKCEYFKDLLFGDQANESNGMQMDVEINNVPLCIFSNIIRWFYTGNIEFSDYYTVLEIYQAAKYYNIKPLIDNCRNYIKCMEITKHNVCSILELCNTIKVNRLKKRCIKYIEQNTFSVINSAEFEKSPFNIVREICQLQSLSLASEAELLEAVLKWLNAQPKLNRNAVKELKRSLLECVRFLSFSAKEFIDVISKNLGLLTAGDSLKILSYLNIPTSEYLEALPEWCNKSQRTLLPNLERKKSGFEKDILSEGSEIGKIKIQLKIPDIEQDVSELTSVLHMKCKKGVHQITSVKFSFQPIENSGYVLADLKITVNVEPNGPKFVKTYFVKHSELTFYFAKAVKVHEGQDLIMEVTAKASQSCKYFQFDKWFDHPKSNFECDFISKPIIGKLYFISEVSYGPLAPRLKSSI